MADEAKLHNRLFKFARKLKCDLDDAHDLATLSLIDAIAAGVVEWHYAAVCLKSNWATFRRNRIRRNEDYRMHEDENGEYIELKSYGHPAPQETCRYVHEVLQAVSTLDEEYRKVIYLAALEFTVDEMVWELEMPKSEVYWRLSRARKLLREKVAPDTVQRKRGHAKYIGIRKDHHRWVAALRFGGKYYHLGYHATAGDAAKAYDMKAVEIYGPAAKLNYPEAA